MRLRGKVHDRVYLKRGVSGVADDFRAERARLVYLEHVVDEVEVADVAVNKAIVGHVRDVSEIVQGAAVVQHVKVDDSVIGILFHYVADDVAAYEAGAAAEQYDAGGIWVGRAAHG